MTIPVIFSTGSLYPFGLERVYAWATEAGFDGVRVARLAGRMEVPVVVTHPPPPGRPLERWKRGPLREAREQGAVVAVENMPRNRAGGLFSVRRGSCYLPEHLANVGEVTFDTSHAGASKVDLLRAHSALATQLRHVHLSDSNLEAGRDEHRLPGKGRLPLKPFLAALATSGYPGAVSLELKPWPLGAPDPETILGRMRATLEFAREGLTL
jgi:sugar phosphate isomerase/epimerase